MLRESQLAVPTRVVTCPIVGFGIIRSTADDIRELRRNPVPLPGKPLAATFLKHAEDQTVAGLAAVYQAIHNFQLDERAFRHWGVIAAPSFPGRASMAEALKRFACEGPWGISPHLIPHQSLHAVSGTISQALAIHGPNFGIGGGPGAVTEALLVVASLMADADLPGLWVVLTDHDGEFVPHSQSGCRALAIALAPAGVSSIHMALHLCPWVDSTVDGTTPDWHGWAPLRNVGDLLDAFSANGRCNGNWRLGDAGWAQLLSDDSNQEA